MSYSYILKFIYFLHKNYFVFILLIMIILRVIFDNVTLLMTCIYQISMIKL